MTPAIEELLKVLDLSEHLKEYLDYFQPEEEQRKIIGRYVIRHHNHKTKRIDWTGSDWTVTPCERCGKRWKTYSERQKDKSLCQGPFPYQGPLADLAFRLRDEVVENIDLGLWEKALEAVYYHSRKHGLLTCDEWFVDSGTPIHYIIAALIAKELAKEKK